MSDTIHLEGFSESLRGSRTFIVGSNPQCLKGVIDRLSADVSNRGRHVLVHYGSAVPRWLQRLGWDAFFNVRDTQDLKLAITFIQHMTKPGRVVWVGDVPGQAVMAHLTKIDGLSLVVAAAQAPSLTPGNEWQAIFWPSGATAEEVESTVVARMGVQGRLRSIMSELRGAGVGLVWSSIREAKGGALYWYDPAEGGQAAPIDPEETAEILRGLADSLTGKCRD